MAGASPLPLLRLLGIDIRHQEARAKGEIELVRDTLQQILNEGIGVPVVMENLKMLRDLEQLCQFECREFRDRAVLGFSMGNGDKAIPGQYLDGFPDRRSADFELARQQSLIDSRTRRQLVIQNPGAQRIGNALKERFRARNGVGHWGAHARSL